MVTGTLFATQLIEYIVTSGSNTLKSVLKRTILSIFPSRLSRTSVRSFLLSCCCRLESRALGVLALVVVPRPASSYHLHDRLPTFWLHSLSLSCSFWFVVLFLVGLWAAIAFLLVSLITLFTSVLSP